jgi:hypothetical protein
VSGQALNKPSDQTANSSPSTESSDRPVNLSALTETSEVSGELLWESILSELDAMVTILRSISKFLFELGGTINAQTLEEINERIRTIYTQLLDFNVWLDDKSEQYWVTLKTSLQPAVDQLDQPQLMANLDAYIRTAAKESQLSLDDVHKRSVWRNEARKTLDACATAVKLAIARAKAAKRANEP